MSPQCLLAPTARLKAPKKGLCAGRREGRSSALKEGGGLVTGQSKEAILKTLITTHHLCCEAAWKNFFQKKIPYDAYLKVISALWGSF